MGVQYGPHHPRKIRFTPSPRAPFPGITDDAADTANAESANLDDTSVQQMHHASITDRGGINIVVIPGHAHNPATLLSEGSPDTLHVTVLPPTHLWRSIQITKQ